MATVLRAQVHLPRATLIPEDESINVWHFLTVGAATPADAATALTTDLGVFYGAIDVYLAGYLSTPATLKIYDLSDVEPRVPISTSTFALTPGTGDGYPAEVAICLSYRAELLSGTNPARRRGRLYLGPLDEDIGVVVTGDMEVGSSVRTAICTAAKNLVIAGATHDARWVVLSPTDLGAPPWTGAALVASSADVVAGYVDNAFDTMRSRGKKATTRTVFSSVLP
jgi:hypothetical protein